MPPHPIDLTPLLRGAHGHQLRVAGVAAGEPAYKVDTRVLTSADERAPAEARVGADGKVYRKAVDGSLQEYPLADRVSATLQGGGTLWIGEVSLRVEAGEIARIFVRGPSLATLPIRREADIERLLGPAEGRERAYGNLCFHYPSRGLVVAWRAGGGHLAYIALGVDPWVEPQLGAPALLAELLAIALPRGNVGGAWAALLTARVGEPRSVGVRRQRVVALCRALGLGAPAAVVNGSFLPQPLDGARQRVLDGIAATAADEGRSPFAATTLMAHLLLYRNDAEQVIQATSGWLECSDPALLGMIAEQNRVAGELRAQLATVDGWVCALLDPAGRTFSLRDLIASHGWPDEDLAMIEMDEL